MIDRLTWYFGDMVLKVFFLAILVTSKLESCKVFDVIVDDVKSNNIILCIPPLKLLGENFKFY